MKPEDFADKGVKWNCRYFMAHWICRLAEKVAPNDCGAYLIENDAWAENGAVGEKISE